MFRETEKSSSYNVPEGRERKRRWDIIKYTIEKQNQELIASGHVEFHEDQDLFNEDSFYDYNPETGLSNSVTQKDGTKVDMKRTIGEEGLKVLEDAIFSDGNGAELLRLASVLPEGYVILEEAKPNHDFMLAGDASVIVMAPDFLCSIDGRVRFLHELGHALDYQEKPKTRSELVDNIQGFATKKREKGAWEKAKDALRTIRGRGIKFLPDGFEETIMWDNFEKDCIEEHDYKDGE